MSIDWDIGFTKRPKLQHLDDFMKSMEFVALEQSIYPAYTRVWRYSGPAQPREINFFYRSRANAGLRSLSKKGGETVVAGGQLVTYSCGQTYPLFSNGRKRRIREKDVKTEYDCYRYLDPELLKWYETALSLRDHFGAIVSGEGTPINPERYYWEGRRKPIAL